MKLSKLNGLAVAALMALGVGGAAHAAPVFTLDPSVFAALGSNTAGLAPFDATFLNGSTSELITATSSTTQSGTGWAQFTGAQNGGTAVNGLLSGINTYYGLYFTYTFTLSLTSGTNLGVNSKYNVDSLTYTVYVDPNASAATTTHFTNASVNVAANTGTAAGITGNADDVVLATGTLDFVDFPAGGTAALNDHLGASLNTTSYFDVCTGAGTAARGGTAIADASCGSNLGSKYFSQPVPFYSVSFAEFNNTSAGATVTSDGHYASITDASGAVDFTINSVPEPASLALVGFALLALGGTLRRRNGA